MLNNLSRLRIKNRADCPSSGALVELSTTVSSPAGVTPGGFLILFLHKTLSILLFSHMREVNGGFEVQMQHVIDCCRLLALDFFWMN